MVKLDHSLANVSNALNHQIGSLHVIEDGIVQLDKIMGTIRIVKLREREGQGVDLGRSLKGHLWMVDGGWWYTFP